MSTNAPGEQSPTTMTKTGPMADKKRRQSLGANMHEDKELVHMKEEDFEKAGISGHKKKLAGFLIGKHFNLYNQILVTVYVIFSILTFSAEVYLEELHLSHNAHLIEATFVGLFLIDCLVHWFSFGKMYIKDPFSIMDLSVIVLVLTFLMLVYFL